MPIKPVSVNRPPSPRIIQQPMMMSFNNTMTKSYFSQAERPELLSTAPNQTLNGSEDCKQRTKRLESNNEFITMCESYLQDITDKYLRSTSQEIDAPKHVRQKSAGQAKKVPRSIINIDVFNKEKGADKENSNSNPVRKPLKPILKKRTQKGQSQPRQ